MRDHLHRRTFCLALTCGWALPRAGSAQSPDRPLEIGVLPNISARVLLAQYQPMREYLARETGRAVQISTAPSWQAFHQSTLALGYDVVVTGAHLARLAQLDRGYVPLLSYLPNMKGLLAYAGSRPIQRINELGGQTLVLSNPQSLVTFRGLQWLAENGLQRERDYRTINTPTDDSVGNVVLRGDATAAMLSGGEFRAMPEAVRAQLQILTTFAEVPGFIVMASPRLPAADTQAIRQHLLRFATSSDEGRQFFEKSGFTAIREPAPGLMESMDPYVSATRRALTPAG
ncbi:PhnD/SsuA/transferrin family substrate-binding protein [uncultured Sphaerotilus sp.]|uniref:phosphate/phosphite/phosphonate ABC transporter substrate-binding protein n=1 Tax=uncultured Sphaerotilus sp. TaxID=474984 RepID=UPI0030CA3561